MKSGSGPQRKQGLKRTPFKRKAPSLKATTSGSAPPESVAKRRSGLAGTSTRKDRDKRSRRALMQWLAGYGVRCEICPELAAAGIVIPGGCSGLGGIHERRKRSGVGSVEHAPNLIPACNNVNGGWIENATGADSARQRFGSWLVVRPEDAEWDALGGRDVVPEAVTVKLCQRCGQAYVTVSPSGRLVCGHLVAA